MFNKHSRRLWPTNSGQIISNHHIHCQIFTVHLTIDHLMNFPWNCFIKHLEIVLVHKTSNSQYHRIGVSHSSYPVDHSSYPVDTIGNGAIRLKDMLARYKPNNPLRKLLSEEVVVVLLMLDVYMRKGLGIHVYLENCEKPAATQD